MLVQSIGIKHFAVDFNVVRVHLFFLAHDVLRHRA